MVTEEVITGKNIVIATGSTSTVPKFIPDHKNIVESRAFLDLENLPKSLLVLVVDILDVS